MTRRESLQELSRQVRRDTLQILQAAEPSWLFDAPAGTTNHILWHAGHALWLQDLLCVRLLTGKSELPDGWDATFGKDCRPVPQTTSWPSRSELVTLLEKQLERIVDLLAETSDERLTEPADSRRGPANVAARIIHGWHDEAKHCGEMYLLLKLCRSGARQC